MSVYQPIGLITSQEKGSEGFHTYKNTIWFPRYFLFSSYFADMLKSSNTHIYIFNASLLLGWGVWGRVGRRGEGSFILCFVVFY